MALKKSRARKKLACTPLHHQALKKGTGPSSPGLKPLNYPPRWRENKNKKIIKEANAALPSPPVPQPLFYPLTSSYPLPTTLSLLKCLFSSCWAENENWICSRGIFSGMNSSRRWKLPKDSRKHFPKDKLLVLRWTKWKRTRRVRCTKLVTWHSTIFRRYHA